MQYPDIKKIINNNPGLQEALIAISAFRHRKDRALMFKTGKRANNRAYIRSTRGENIRLSRKYIKLARQKGWRGSIIKALVATK